MSFRRCSLDSAGPATPEAAGSQARESGSTSPRKSSGCIAGPSPCSLKKTREVPSRYLFRLRRMVRTPFMAFLKNIFDGNEREVARVKRTAVAVNALEDEISALSDEALRAKTSEFRERLETGESLDAMLPEVFAV